MTTTMDKLEVADCLETAAALARFVVQLNRMSQHAPEDSVFRCVCMPKISLTDFASRLGTNAGCSRESFVVAAVVASRLFRSHPQVFCDAALHKILGACVVVALKVSDDRFYANSYYATCLGVSLHELNRLELEVLLRTQYSVFVSAADFQAFDAKLRNAGSAVWFDPASKSRAPFAAAGAAPASPMPAPPSLISSSPEPAPLLAQPLAWAAIPHHRSTPPESSDFAWADNQFQGWAAPLDTATDPCAASHLPG